MQISLNISGFCRSRQWVNTFVKDGSLTFDDLNKNIETLTLTGENYAYVVCHTDNQTVYILVDHKVNLPDSEGASGLLMVGVALPSEAQLQGGESPLDLLRLLYHTFVDEYMTATTDGYHTFTDREINMAQFRSILNSYEPLETSGSPYILTTTRTGGASRPKSDNAAAADNSAPGNDHGSQLFMAAVAGLILGLAIMWFAYPLFHASTADEHTVDAVETSVADEHDKAAVSLGEEIKQNHTQLEQQKAAGAVQKADTSAVSDPRSVVLESVNAGMSIYRIRNLAEWEQLSKGDKLAVEAVCNTKQHGIRRDTVEKYINETYPEGFASWDELEKARRKIFKLAPR